MTEKQENIDRAWINLRDRIARDAVKRMEKKVLSSEDKEKAKRIHNFLYCV